MHHVQIPFDGDTHPSVVKLFVWQNFLSLQSKQVLDVDSCDLIEHHGVVVLKLKVSVLDFPGNYLTHLAADWDVT
jgi:hypothetical protein